MAGDRDDVLEFLLAETKPSESPGICGLTLPCRTASFSKEMNANVKYLTRRPAWELLAEHSKEIKKVDLRQLFAEDASRGERLTVEAAGLFLDYSKNRIMQTTLKLLLQLAEESGLHGGHRTGQVSRNAQRLPRNRRTLPLGSFRAKSASPYGPVGGVVYGLSRR